MRLLLSALIYFGLLIISILVLRDVFGTDSTAAAWVQGVGSIAAISATGFIALAQIMQDSEQRTLDRTIAACDRYRFDPTIYAAYQKMYDEIKLGYVPPRLETMTFLNYLDSVAYGVNNNFYEYGYVNKNIPIAEYIDELLDDSLTKAINTSTDEFQELVKLRKRIGGLKTPPRYNMAALAKRPPDAGATSKQL